MEHNSYCNDWIFIKSTFDIIGFNISTTLADGKGGRSALYWGQGWGGGVGGGGGGDGGGGPVQQEPGITLLLLLLFQKSGCYRRILIFWILFWLHSGALDCHFLVIPDLCVHQKAPLNSSHLTRAFIMQASVQLSTLDKNLLPDKIP